MVDEITKRRFYSSVLNIKKEDTLYKHMDQIKKQFNKQGVQVFLYVYVILCT